MRQPREVPERIQIRQLGDVILRQNKCRQSRYRSSDSRLNLSDAIPREKKHAETREEGEIREGGDIVVCEVDCILVLHHQRSVPTHPSTHFQPSQNQSR
jgi:hypothetical protein